MDGATACAQELVLAIFRLAVADCLGRAYGHDGPCRPRRVENTDSLGAAAFLASPWADHLAGISGFSAVSVRNELVAANSEQEWSSNWSPEGVGKQEWVRTDTHT
jgi:hypothetical protein